MPRKLLVFAAIAVLGSMLVLYLVTRDSGGEAAETGDEPVAQVRENGETDLRRNRPALADDPDVPVSESGEARPAADQRGLPRNDDPSRPRSATVEATERGSATPQQPYAEYTLPDGRKVRDFRDPANRQPMEVPPSIHPPGGRKIKPELTGLFTDQILGHMRECRKPVPKSVLGAKPRLEGQIVIAIEAGQASVTNAVFRLTEVTDAAIAETAKKCVEEKTLTVKVPAPDEADLDAYSINLSFAFQ